VSNPYAALPEDAWASPAPEPVPPPPVDRFAHLGEFMDKLVRPTYRRYLSGSRLWCDHWFHHAEAVAYLHAIWRAYEHMKREDEHTGTALWIRDHLYPCLDRLMDPDGAFKLCGEAHAGGDDGLQPLPSIAWEQGLFDNL
jgi:hypothetical protein